MSDVKKPGKLNTSFFEKKIAEQTNAANTSKPQPGKLNTNLFSSVGTPVSRQMSSSSNSVTSDSTMGESTEIIVDTSNNINRTGGRLGDRTALFNSISRHNSNGGDNDSMSTTDSTSNDPVQPSRKIGKLNIDLSGINAALAQGPKLFGTGPRATPTHNASTNVQQPSFHTNITVNDMDQPHTSPAPYSDANEKLPPQHSRTMSSISTGSNYLAQYTNYASTPVHDNTSDTPINTTANHTVDTVTVPLVSKTATRATVNRNKQRKLPAAVTSFIPLPIATTLTLLPVVEQHESTTNTTQPTSTTPWSTDSNLVSYVDPFAKQIPQSDTSAVKQSPMATQPTTTVSTLPPIPSQSSTLSGKRPSTIQTTPAGTPSQHTRTDTFTDIDDVLDNMNVSDVTPVHTAKSSVDIDSPIPAPPPVPVNASELDTPTPRYDTISPTVDNVQNVHVQHQHALSTTVHTDRSTQKQRLEGLLRAGPPAMHNRSASSMSNTSDTDPQHQQPTTAPSLSDQPLQSYIHNTVTRPNTYPTIGNTSRTNSISIQPINEYNEQSTPMHAESPVSHTSTSSGSRPPPLPITNANTNNTFHTNITSLHTPPPIHHTPTKQIPPITPQPVQSDEPTPQQRQQYRQRHGYDLHRAEHYIGVLTSGVIVTLHHHKHKPIQCSLFVVASSGFLYCSDVKTKSQHDHYYSEYIGYIKQILPNNQHDIWHHKKTKDIDNRLCMSILSQSQQLHIQTPTHDARNEIYEALMYARAHVEEIKQGV